MYEAWLTKKISIAEAETSHAVRDDRLGPDPIPFGFVNDQWRALLAQCQEGDELWSFSSPKQDWRNMAGRAGIALVRRGKIVECLVTRMN